MKCTLSTQSYQWQNADGSYGVGKLVEVEAPDGDCENMQVWERHGIYHHADAFPEDRVLIAHSHTRELEFVEFGRLQPYGPPGSPAMPQPTTTEERGTT
jgi:hypothetical protein